MVSEKEIEAAREAWREYWCEEDVPRNTKDGMTAALEAAARVRAEGDNECGEAVIPAPQPSGPVGALDEGLEILNGLIDNIKRRGNYSPEATCTFIDQAGQCLREALSALTAGKPEQEQSEEHRYAERLLIALMEKHYPDRSPEWAPLPDLMGVLTQIDNLTTGLVRAAPTAGGGDE